VLAADVQVTIGGRILGDARGAQQDLAEGGVRALGQVQDLLLVELERGGAKAGLDEVTVPVEFGGDDHRIELGWGRGGRRVGLRTDRGVGADEGEYEWETAKFHGNAAR
jgi:hypothetical protein